MKESLHHYSVCKKQKRNVPQIKSYCFNQGQVHMSSLITVKRWDGHGWNVSEHWNTDPEQKNDTNNWVSTLHLVYMLRYCVLYVTVSSVVFYVNRGVFRKNHYYKCLKKSKKKKLSYPVLIAYVPMKTRIIWRMEIKRLCVGVYINVICLWLYTV